MNEGWRLLVEGMGAALVVVALALVHVALAVFVAGVILIWVANVYMGGTADAGIDEHDS